MCGLAGALIGSNRKRSWEELEAIGQMFTRLLTLSERRGPHATGVALVGIGGDYYVSKAPNPAGRFVQSRNYRTIIGRLDASTTLLMGHTRWPTRGSHLNNANNHPLVGGTRARACILSHNGHIGNADALFGAMGVRRKTQVDSEILLRMAELEADLTAAYRQRLHAGPTVAGEWLCRADAGRSLAFPILRRVVRRRGQQYPRHG